MKVGGIYIVHQYLHVVLDNKKGQEKILNMSFTTNKRTVYCEFFNDDYMLNDCKFLFTSKLLLEMYKDLTID